MKTLYPDIDPFDSAYLSTDDGHEVYFEQAGHPQGVPVIFLHGGPGSGCKPYHRSFFDPERYRIILMDQRGTGRSLPAGELRGNSTDRLISDMEAIRQRLGIDRWVLFGGSWGSTLALLYAQQHTSRVLGLILRGSFLARQSDVDWFLKDGVNHLFPEDWSKFRAFIGPADDVPSAYYQRLERGGSDAREAARAWDLWGGAVVLGADFDPTALAGEVPDHAYHQALIETHYAIHQYFIEPNQILNHCGRLIDLPCTLIHGQQDLMCPLESSWLLKQQLPRAELVVLPNATHLAQGEPMIDALVHATDQMADLLS